MPAERKTPPPCPHEQEFGENTIWPDDVSLAHFDKCLTPEGRLWVWTGARKMADKGSRCTLYGHETAVHRVQALLQDRSLLMQAARTDQAYISSLTAQLRELLAYCQAERTDHARFSDSVAVACFDDMVERLQAILGTRAQSVEQVEP